MKLYELHACNDYEWMYIWVGDKEILLQLEMVGLIWDIGFDWFFWSIFAFFNFDMTDLFVILCW